MELQPVDGADLDLHRLNHELDKAKAAVFMGKAANFFGSLMCYQNFIWTDAIPTAAVDGVNFYWSPKWFDALPEDTRKTVIMHELWHIARLDLLRVGARDPLVWNYACDISINNELEDAGYTFVGWPCWKDQKYRGWVTEDIYDDLIVKQVDWKAVLGIGDMLEPTEEQKQQQIGIVTQTAHTVEMTGGELPGEVQKILKQFLAPIIPWEAMLWKFFQDMLDNDFSWAKRDRRYPNIYLPGEEEDDGRLEHLAYFFDVSGSVTDPQVIRFNSEVKFIKDNFQPKKLTLLQFDTIIQDTLEFKEEDPFEEILVKGRGGTDLTPVRDWIIEHKPTAAIIFSDLYCAPMEPLPVDIPIIWVAIGNRSASVPFGQIIHIKA